MAAISLLERLDGIEGRFEEVGTLITDPSVIADQKRYVKLTKEYHDLELIVNATRRYRQMLSNIEEAQEVLRYGKVRTLYPRDQRDAYVLFALKNGYDVDQLNDLLFEHNEKIFE